MSGKARRTPVDAEHFGDAPFPPVDPATLSGAAGEPLDGAYAPDESFDPESRASDQPG